MADAANRGDWIEDNPQLYWQGLFEESNTQKHPLGTIRKLSDGREFIYVKMGATNAVAGSVYQAVAPVVANHANLAVTANANVGDKKVSITMGDSTLANTANALAEGYLWINTGASNGQAYKIKNHAAIAANANGDIYLYDKIRSANVAAATSKASVLKHPCKEVIIHPSPPTNTPVGVATYVMTANYYGWLQKKGPCAVEVDGTVVNGDGVRCSANVDGAVEPSANGTETEYHVGVVMCNNANDHWCLVDLKL